jgi:hypothetical protein
MFDLATATAVVICGSWTAGSVIMKIKLVLKIAVVIGVLALISAGYCFWLMSVPLSYHWVPFVLIGFVVAIGVFVISLITSLIVLIRLRGSGRAPNVS